MAGLCFPGGESLRLSMQTEDLGRIVCLQTEFGTSLNLACEDNLRLRFALNSQRSSGLGSFWIMSIRTNTFTSTQLCWA